MSVHCCRPYECHGAKVRSQQQISTVCACVAELETQVHWKVGLYQHFSDAGSHTVDSQMTGRERDAATAVKTQETIILFWLLLFLYQESWCCRFSVRRRLQRDWHTSSISINVYRALNISRLQETMLMCGILKLSFNMEQFYPQETLIKLRRGS